MAVSGMKSFIENLALDVENRGASSREIVLFVSYQFHDAIAGVEHVPRDDDFYATYAKVLTLDVPTTGQLSYNDYPYYDVIRPIQEALPAILSQVGRHVITATLERSTEGHIETMVGIVERSNYADVADEMEIDENTENKENTAPGI